MGVVLRFVVRISTGRGLHMPSSPPIIAQSSVAEIKGYALIDACGDHLLCLDEIECIHGSSFSNDGSSLPIK